MHLFREDQKKSFGKATDFECDSLFVPNPNMSTIQILLDGLNNKKCAGRKKMKDFLPRRAGRGGSVRILTNPKILPPMTAKK